MEYITGLHNGDTAIINIESILSDPEILKRRFWLDCFRSVMERQADRGFQCRRRIVKRNPVAALNGELIALQLRFVADDHPVLLRVEFDHVERVR